MKRLTIVGMLVALLLSSLVVFPPATTAQETNPASCVETYDETVDYFPAKVEAEHAEGFTVEYFDHYKVVTVTAPWPGATEEDNFQYVLYQCGTPRPEGFEDAQLLEVPAGEVIALSTTQLPHLVELGVLDTLVGLDSFLYTNTPEVRELIEAGELIEVGSGPEVNIELVLDAEPDVVMAFGSGTPDYDTHPVLLDNDIFVVINAEWVEHSPLARAEWIKFTAVFFNKEAEANAYFEDVEQSYNELVALVEDIPAEEQPTVLTGTYTSFGDSWNIAGTDSYVGQFIRDAGARHIFADDERVQDETGSVLFDFETVYAEALEADYWLPNVFSVNNLDDLKNLDERYTDFVAFAEERVYNDSARVNENGGNDVFESGVINPHILLADLIKIFHPELLPDHELVYYEQLQ